MRSPARQKSPAAVLFLLAAAAGCSDGTAVAPGKTCIVNSDCTDPLSCTFNKCHEACRKDGDCTGGGRCVYGYAAGEGDGGSDAAGADAGGVKLRICLPENEKGCVLDS